MIIIVIIDTNIAGVSCSILSGEYESEEIPNEELVSLASCIIIAILLTGVIVSLLSYTLEHARYLVALM